MFKELLIYGMNYQKEHVFQECELICLAGEAVTEELLNLYKKMLGGKANNLYIAYGPTEGTVCGST